MTSKLLPLNRFTLCFISLFLLVSGQEKTQKNIFDETYLKHLKLKNRFFRGSVGDLSFKDGKITKNAKIRLLRDGKKLVETTITTLQREKQDVKEVSQNMECGIKMEGWNDIILGDIIEAFVMEQVIRD